MLGGIENISSILAREFVRAGHQVHIITQTPGDDDETYSYAVTRRPSHAEIMRLARWSDVFFQNNISIRTLMTALPVQSHIVIAYQTWIRRTDGRPSLFHWLKSQASRFAVRNVAISQAVAESIPSPCVLIPNPYDHVTFRRLEEIKRDRELIFVGRIVSDKGADILLDALGRLAQEGVRPKLTIVGSGPDEPMLRTQVAQLGLHAQVTFAGPLRGELLARVLNQHRILIVPSRWAEPFGIVALEAAACGCMVIGSSGGGLPDAIGPCGFTFPNGDAKALSELIAWALRDPSVVAERLLEAPPHLLRHRGDSIAGQYLNLFSELLA